MMIRVNKRLSINPAMIISVDHYADNTLIIRLIDGSRIDLVEGRDIEDAKMLKEIIETHMPGDT